MTESIVTEPRFLPHPPLEFPVSVAVRELRETDSHLLEWQGGADLRRWYAAQWRAHAAGDIFVIVADLDGYPVGQGAVHWNGKTTHLHIPDIQSLRVFGAFRGRGIGSLLLHACENAVRERGIEQVSISVAIDNPRARQLYERCGYVVTGEPYEDRWEFTNAASHRVHIAEQVLDLVKNL